MITSLRATACALALMLAGCSNPAPKKKAVEKPPEPVTGRYALYPQRARVRVAVYQHDRSIAVIDATGAADLGSVP